MLRRSANKPLPELVPLPPSQNPEVVFYCDDDLWVKQIIIAKAGDAVPQHSHEHDHVTMLAIGMIDVWVDGAYLGEMEAPRPITIKAGTKHLFQAVTDGCILYCIHNLHGQGYPAIREEHFLEG